MGIIFVYSIRMRKYLIALLLLVGFSLNAQNAKSFQRDYADAKDKLHEGKYEEAMQLFDALSVENEDNPFYVHAHYYYGMAALKSGKLLDANFKLAQIESKYPTWDMMEEVYYLRSIVSFENGEYNKAFSFIKKIEDRSILKEIRNEKLFYLTKIEDINKLIELQNNYPEDKEIAEVLAARLNKPTLGVKNKVLLEYLIQDFELKPSDYPHARVKRSQKKEVYRVAVLLPFNLPEGEKINDYLTSRNFGRNKKYYEIFKGIQLAVDSLKKQGVKIELLAYDTRRDTARVKEILLLPEFKNIDLIIGPVLEPTTKMVAAYAENMQVNMVNPINEIGYLFSGYEHAYFTLPSGKVLAEGIYQFTKNNFLGSSVTIVHGSQKVDSIAALHYKKLLQKDSLKNDTIRMVGVDLTNVRNVVTSLAKSNMSNISHIVVFASSRRESQFIATYMMDPLEASPSKPAVIVPADWMDVDQFSYQQMHNNNLHFIFNGCVKEDKEAFKDYKEAYRERWNMLYTQEYELLGFEVMKFFGMEMKKYGNLFNYGITVASYESPYAFMGFDFKESTENSYVPLIIMDENYYFKCVNKTPRVNEY